MTLLLITAAALLLLLIGTPVFVVICGLALYLFSANGIDLSAVIIEIHRLATTPVLVAIPLFTFAGYLLSDSGAPRRLIRLADALLGWLPGGLSVIALGTCAIFTALRSDRPYHHRLGRDPASGNEPRPISGALFPGAAYHLRHSRPAVSAKPAAE